MFEKILIANRGEIAVRIIRTCKKLGIGTVAVYSEADARNLHVQEADEAVLIGSAPASESYLVKERIIDAAIQHKCQAIHPGYGFLSENAEFCEMVGKAGLTFIGPPATAIAAMGDKIASKELAVKAGVPIVPGHAKALTGVDEAVEVAECVGYPVLLKPSAGGGGKGMRIVNSKKEMKSALSACIKETKKAFGDDQIFMEKYILNPRHIEIQIISDYHGQTIYLVERECSIQRRYQKVIEETPSVAVDESLRKKMGECACNLARESGYVNVGTVEYILDQEGDFYFLEMNTRLQVEHPITEMVTGLDLVEIQLKIASGEPLSLRQEYVGFTGWAIEARICAEDPNKHFLPSIGMVTRYAEPWGENIRVDSGIQAGSLIGVYYDSMLSKVVCWGETREDARALLTNALNGYHVEGMETNVYFVNDLINHPAFIKGDLSTDFIARHIEDSEAETVLLPIEYRHHLVLAATLIYHNRQNLVKLSLKPMATHVGSVPKPKEETHYIVRAGDEVYKLKLRGDQISKQWFIQVDQREYQVITPDFEFYRRRLRLEIDGKPRRFRLEFQKTFIWMAYCGMTRSFEVYSPKEWELIQYMPIPRKLVNENVLESPMPGLVVDVRAKKGERVYRGEELVIMESMKMESGVPSPCDGEILEVLVKKGQAVETGDIMVKFVTEK